MKRLILLFCLLVKFSASGQIQEVSSAAADSAVINLRSILFFSNSDRCTRAVDIQITDNGDYTTSFVHRYYVTALDSGAAEPLMLERLGFNELRLFTVPAPQSAIVDNLFVFSTPIDYIDALEFSGQQAITTSGPQQDVLQEIFVFTTPVVYIDPIELTSNEPLATAQPHSITIGQMITIDSGAIPEALRDTEVRMPVEIMHLSADGYSLLEKLEGFSPDLYNLNDGGFTIGFGFFVPYTESYKWSKGVTVEEAEKLIRQKVPAYEEQVKKYINVPLTQNEFDALTLLAYNIGGFAKATSIVEDMNEQADFEKLQNDWKKFIHSKAPKVTKGLMRRRNDEIEVRRYSNYQPERKVQILKSKK